MEKNSSQAIGTTTNAESNKILSVEGSSEKSEEKKEKVFPSTLGTLASRMKNADFFLLCGGLADIFLFSCGCRPFYTIFSLFPSLTVARRSIFRLKGGCDGGRKKRKFNAIFFTLCVRIKQWRVRAAEVESRLR